MAGREMSVRERLFALRDDDYAAFQRRLMPTVDPDTVIGVRTPVLRGLAKELRGTPEAETFLASLPHGYYDENNLHGFLISLMKDYGDALAAVDDFLPYVDNWATCDLLSPRAFAGHAGELLPEIKRWMGSGETYTVRFGLGMLMSHYLDGNFKPEYLELAAGVRSDEYYVNMMVAWFFATALAKQYDETLPYIAGRRLGAWAHNKAIQKAIESYRITDGQKAELRLLKTGRSGSD